MKTIALNPVPFPKDLLYTELRQGHVFINRFAETYFAHPKFSTEDAGKMTVLITSLREIGMESGAALMEIAQAIQTKDLYPCPVNTGLFLRLGWKDQPQSASTVLTGTHSAPDGSVTVFSEILEPDDAFPKGLYLRNTDGRLWLRGYICDSAYRFSGDDLFAFGTRRL